MTRILINANLVKRIFKVSKPALPLSAYVEESFFKIYHIDVGLLRSQSKLSYRALAEGDRLFKEFKGALGENFVVQLGNDIIPIEIKSGKSVFSPSIIEYKKM